MKKVLLVLPLVLAASVGTAYAVSSALATDVYFTKADIAFTSNSVNVDLFETYQTSVANEQLNKLVTWVSSNNEVAGISSTGLISTRSVGKSTITASYGKLSSSFTLTVFSSGSAPYISLSESNIKLASGDAYYVSADTFFKNQKVEDADITWSSADNNVCIVSGNNNGAEIKATGGGSTQIFASLTYRGYFVNSVINVEVVDTLVAVDFDKEAVKNVEGEYIAYVQKDMYLDMYPVVYINGKVSSLGFTWSSGDAEIATVNNDGVVYGVGLGETYLFGNFQNKTYIVVKIVVTK